MVFWKKKKGDRPASKYEKRTFKFDAVKAAFLALHGARYKVTDVKVATFWDPDEDDIAYKLCWCLCLLCDKNR
jgi:hypothetical protein